MDDSLLVSLRQYRPREGRDSLEDFITEVFAWLLRNVEGVAAKVLETTVMRMRADRRIDVPMCDVTWDTQVAYPGARLDMLAQWAGGAILFEHKVHAALHQEQVLRYQELAQNHFEGQEARVVVISTTFDQHRSKPMAASVGTTSTPHWKSMSANAITRPSSFISTAFWPYCAMRDCIPLLPSTIRPSAIILSLESCQTRFRRLFLL